MTTTSPTRLPPAIETALQRVRLAARVAAEKAVNGLGLAALSATSTAPRDALLGGQFELNRKLAVFTASFNETMEDSVSREVTPLVVCPGSAGVGREIARPDPRLGGDSVASGLRVAGGEIRRSGCGPCFGPGPDALAPGERAITSFNRNWQNRMGLGGEGYLASPAVVAASALAGYMAPPGARGLVWDPELFGIRFVGIAGTKVPAIA